MLWCLSKKYDLNHQSAVPKMPNFDEGVVKELDNQSYQKQLRDLVK